MKGDGQPNGSPPPAAQVEEKKPLIEYPAVYTFKVMGRQAADFATYVRELFQRMLEGKGPDSIVELPSGKGTYVSLSVSVRLESEEQRRSIYEQLHADPRIVYYL
jgi:uncharacterized protein